MTKSPHRHDTSIKLVEAGGASARGNKGAPSAKENSKHSTAGPRGGGRRAHAMSPPRHTQGPVVSNLPLPPRKRQTNFPHTHNRRLGTRRDSPSDADIVAHSLNYLHYLIVCVVDLALGSALAGGHAICTDAEGRSTDLPVVLPRPRVGRQDGAVLTLPCGCICFLSFLRESLRRLPWCTCVSASARQSRAQLSCEGVWL